MYKRQVNNNIGVVANHKSQGTVFTQADKKLTLNTIALGKYSDNKVTSIGCSGYSIPKMCLRDRFNMFH